MATAKTKTEMAEGRRALGKLISSGWRSRRRGRRCTSRRRTQGRGRETGTGMRREGVQLARMCDGVVVRSHDGIETGIRRVARERHRNTVPPPGIREKDTRVDATRVDSELFDRRPQRPPTTRSDRHDLPAAARPRLALRARALFVRHSDHGEAADAGKGGGRGSRPPPRRRHRPTTRRMLWRSVCPPLGRRCREIRVSSASRRRVVRPPSRIARPPFHSLTPRFPFPPPREGSGRAAHAPSAR